MTYRGKIEPMPSPSGGNKARMFIFHAAPGQSAELALDAAIRRQTMALDGLRDDLHSGLGQMLGDEQLGAAMDWVDECLKKHGVGGDQENVENAAEGQEKVYGKNYGGEGQDQEEERRSRLTPEEREAEDAEVAQSFFHGGDRRSAKDSRMAMDAEDSFEAFYGTSRIRNA